MIICKQSLKANKNKKKIVMNHLLLKGLLQFLEAKLFQVMSSGKGNEDRNRQFC